MESISVSQFKATCLKRLEQVRKSGQPLMVTKWGEPLVVLNPPPKSRSGKTFGSMKGSVEFIEDILAPLPKEIWEV